MTRKFVSKFDFVSWIRALQPLPFLLLAIEHSWGRQTSWNGTHLGMIFLKNPQSMIAIRTENPQKPGSKAAETFDRYKAATNIQDATGKGANWQDLSSDFDKGFLKVCGPSPLESLNSESIKQAAPEGTPDGEAEARSKIQSTVLSPKLFLNWQSPCPRWK